LWAPLAGTAASEGVVGASTYQPQIELVGSTIGILGIVFFIAGLFYTREPVMH